MAGIEAGDHIRWKRSGVYYHHAIVTEVIGWDELKVIQYDGEPGNKSSVSIVEGIVDRVQDGVAPEFVSRSKFPADVIKRGRSRLEVKEYNLATNNCEHFANWCMNEVARSKQVEIAAGASAGTILGVGALAVGASYAGVKLYNWLSGSEEKEDKEKEKAPSAGLYRYQ